MGAVKAGVTIVTFDEKDNMDSLSQALAESKCRGLLFSPSTEIDPKNQVTRETFVKRLMPELHGLYPGDALDLSKYPDLKQIIQLGHSSIRGVVKFRDAMVYANPKLSTKQLSDNSASD